MNKGRLSGAGKIFAFTFSQASKKKGFKFMTYVMPILIFACLFAVTFIWGMAEDKEPSSLKTLYIVDNAGDGMVTECMKQVLDEEKFPDVVYRGYTGSDAEDVKKEMGTEDKNCVLLVTEKAVNEEGEDCLKATAYLPEWSDVTEDDCEDLLSAAEQCLQAVKIMNSGIDGQDIIYLSCSVFSQYKVAGEESESVGVVLVRMLSPMFVILVIYMIVLLYGQSIGKSILEEKSSKLMEFMLINVKPDAIIFGKTAAMWLMAILQVLLAVIFGIAGYKIGEMCHPGFVCPITEAVNEIGTLTGSAFGIPALLLCLLATIIGFLFYCVLSSFFASFISKPEEMAQTMGVYNILVVLGFLGAYMAVFSKNPILLKVDQLIPFMAAFAVPGNILCGTTSLLEGVLYIGLLLIFSIIMIIIAGKAYRNLVFYRGSNPLKRLKKKIQN